MIFDEIELSTGEQGALWTTVDNPVDKSAPRGRDSMSVFKDKSLNSAREGGSSLFLGALVEALANAVDVLAARVEHVELLLEELLAYSDQPLTPDELVARLRQLRDELRGGT